MIEQAIILAAGFGKRLRPITNSIPKPLLLINNKPIIVYLLESLAKAGIKSVVIHVSYLADKIIQEIGDGKKWNLNIKYCLSDMPLESGGGIKKSMQYLDLDNKQNGFLCINGDIFTDFDFSVLTNYNLSPEDLGSLVLVDNPVFNLTGDFSIDKNHKLSLVPSNLNKNTYTSYTYSGIAVYNYKLLDYLNKIDKKLFSIKECYIKNLHLFNASVYHGIWHDVGTIERYNYIQNQFNYIKNIK